MWMESLYRFFFGGLIVSLFAVIGSMLKPTSFAGVFGAAPSVALATLGLTIAKQGGSYAAVECRSMLIGAAALWAYSLAVSRMLMLGRFSALAASTMSFTVWAGCAFVLWFAFLR